ncbi:hypothetical protein [Pseudoxanthomonas mexicana]
MSKGDIPISNLVMSQVQATRVLHFTGGLICLPLEEGGWALGPIGASQEGLSFLSPMPEGQVHMLARQAGTYFVGTKVVYKDSGPERDECWYCHIGNTGATEQSADTWSAIAFRASQAKDESTAELARYMSICMRSASRRLCEISDLHHEQLRWALMRGRDSGERFSNTALYDLHLAIHSFLAELSSTRDYLSILAARRVGAPKHVDSLRHLRNWLGTPTGSAANADGMIVLILDALGTEARMGWLRRMTKLRNQVTHQRPMGADPLAGALRFQRVATASGLLPQIRITPWSAEEIAEGEDPFIEILRFWLGMEALAHGCTKFMDYPAEHPHFFAADLQ